MNRNPKLTYVIRRTRFFRDSEDKRDLVADENGDAIMFNGSKAAKTCIATLQAEIYKLAHQEAGRPEYGVFRLDQLPHYLKLLL